MANSIEGINIYPRRAMIKTSSPSCPSLAPPFEGDDLWYFWSRCWVYSWGSYHPGVQLRKEPVCSDSSRIWFFPGPFTTGLLLFRLDGQRKACWYLGKKPQWSPSYTISSNHIPLTAKPSFLLGFSMDSARDQAHTP